MVDRTVDLAADPVLIIDVNGVRGSSVAQALLRKNYHVRGWTQARDSEAALGLQRQGAEIVSGPGGSLERLEMAMTGAAAVVLAGSPFESGMPAESRLGERIIETAQRNGIPFLVMLSIAGAEQGTGIPQFDSKGIIEEYLRAAGLPFAILAPTFLMENLLTINILAQLRQGRLSLPLGQDRRLQMLAARDLGAFACQVLERPGEFNGQRVALASDEVTGRQMAAALSHRVGRPVEYQARPIEQVRAWNPDYAQMFEWLDRIGFNSNVEGLRHRWPEIGWRRFDTWAAEQNWMKLLGAYEAA